MPNTPRYLEQGPEARPRNLLADYARDYGLHGLSNRLNDPTSGIGLITDAVGSVAMPAYNALMSPYRALTGEMGDYETNKDAYIQAGMDVAGTAMTGGLAAPRPQNSLGALSSRIQKQIHEAQVAANPGVDPNKLTQAMRMPDGYVEINSPVGYISAEQVNGGPLRIMSSGLDGATERGKGYGAALYDGAAQYASSYGVPLQSDSMVSPAASRMYQRLERDYGVEMSPNAARQRFGSIQTADDSPVFTVNVPPSGAYPPPLPDALFANGGKPGAATGAAVNALADQPQGIRAYHGSPHDFDRFDISKIGTGEGAQAFGHGLYFAENEGVAKSYKKALGGQRMKDGAPFDELNPAHWAADAIERAGGDKTKAASILSSEMTPDMKIHDGGQYQRLLRAKGMIERGEQVPEIGAGHLYEVRINADPEHFLDWDKPLSQQSEKVRGLLSPELEQAQRLAQQRDFMRSRISGNPSSSAIDEIELLQNSVRDPAIADRLKAGGIPGIKYLDQGSRSAGEGSRNYVVFDDKLIDIMRKYGLMGMLGGGAAALAGAQANQPQTGGDWTTKVRPGDA